MRRQHTPAMHGAHQAKSNEASPQTSHVRLVSRSAMDIVCSRGHRCGKREIVSRSLSRSCSRSRSANCLASSKKSSSAWLLTVGPLRRRRLFGAEGAGSQCLSVAASLAPSGYQAASRCPSAQSGCWLRQRLYARFRVAPLRQARKDPIPSFQSVRWLREHACAPVLFHAPSLPMHASARPEVTCRGGVAVPPMPQASGRAISLMCSCLLSHDTLCVVSMFG